MMLKKIRELLPYFILISIYFFFVNIEARNEHKRNKIELKTNKISNKNKDDLSNIYVFNERIEIPVIPYED